MHRTMRIYRRTLQAYEKILGGRRFGRPASASSFPRGKARVAGVEILTGDTNIVSVAMTLQYVIRNPAAFLFTVLGMPVDEVLTTGRLTIQERVKRRRGAATSL
jgi:regulator of protease activity HflC (stomatin/prohibitin superfamily)